MNFLRQPWPWYIAGPLIGLTVPVLLLLGNKAFGISSSLRHICAALLPSKIPFFTYDWRKELWNLFFAGGIVIGAAMAWFLFRHQPGNIHPLLLQQLHPYGITGKGGFMPDEIFSWHYLVTPRSLLLILGGGFLVGFGTRYAGGCTSGHSITGLSNLQPASLVATICFMAGGFLMTHLFLPILLKL